MTCNTRPGVSTLRAVSHFDVTATDGAARAGILRTAHGEVPTPAFMPVGTKATVKTLDPGRAARRRGHDRARQHLPPPLPPGRGRDRRARRPAPLHGLGRPDPHRLGRLPGLLAARHAARGRRRRRHLPLGLRRQPGPLHAGARRRDPARARLGHRDVPRHLPARRRAARRAGGGGAPNDALGAAAARRAARAGAAALRDHAGRRRPRAPPALDRGDRRARLRRRRARRAQRGGGPGRDVRGGLLGGAAPPGRRGRATSWGSATRRGSCA